MSFQRVTSAVRHGPGLFSGLFRSFAMGGAVAGELCEGRKHPPTFIAYSRADGRGEQSTAFAERLRASGTDVTLFDGSAYTHMSIDRDFGEGDDALTVAALAFLKSTVG
ncbi:hypothetical protein [Mesorhizobium salmacidum]|uniref:Alpha/beta hydrolase fold-3 domain-containing protein n=1 Tax=Mesorhizobium salmacidum TaxID=3015171 RepID=A0ABU8KS07_9HYPH